MESQGRRWGDDVCLGVVAASAKARQVHLALAGPPNQEAALAGLQPLLHARARPLAMLVCPILAPPQPCSPAACRLHCPHRRPLEFAMAPKTVEEQLAELEMEAEAPAPPIKHAKKSRAPRQKREQDEADALKELEELEALDKLKQPEAPRPSSRPNTPKLSSSSTTSSQRRGPGAVTPSSTASARTSEEKTAPPRKSAESARSFHQSFTPTAEEDEPATKQAEDKQAEDKQAGGSWWGGGWGGLLSTATATATAAADAAKKQAEAAYQEIQKNQDAQRWADQVRGNVGALRGIGQSLIGCSHSRP